MNQFQSLGEVISAFKRRFLLVLVIIAIGSAISVYFALNQTKRFAATAVVQIEGATVSNATATQSRFGSEAAMQIRLIEQRLMSRDNLAAVIEKFNLYSATTELSINEKVVLLREEVRVSPILNPAQAWQANATPSGLTINVEMGDAQNAADVANDFLYTVIDSSRERGAERTESTLEFYAAEEARMSAEIEELSNQIAQFKIENADYLPAGQTSLRTQLGNLHNTELSLEQQIVSLQSGSSRQRQDVVDQQVSLLEDQKTLITSRIANIENALLESPEVEKEFDALTRDLTRLQDQYTVITRRKDDAELDFTLENNQKAGKFEILETAIVPEHPISRSPKVVAAMGVVATTLVAIAAVLSLEMANPVIRTAAQLERAMGVQPVISIPHVNTKKDKRKGLTKRLLGLVFVVTGLGVAARYLQDWIGNLNIMPRRLNEQP